MEPGRLSIYECMRFDGPVFQEYLKKVVDCQMCMELDIYIVLYLQVAAKTPS